MRCVAAAAFLVLRDRLAGETLKSETLRMWLTRLPRGKRSTCNGNQPLSKSSGFS
ncbi:hypothetical protein QUF49_00225 [Fictibacillus sp. b24]|uniref:hypothetical protein n=1 Tax=Fictibacillus sp. b24 TaxID=3055863 RepID=UPI0025A23FD7|nr:hypothetical protein [Fictibacillus sp. b24]MDM5314404.1 hypothetical protein [Fictibacillus sp. b24]